jgi:DNA-binding transcriptional MerR regulator
VLDESAPPGAWGLFRERETEHLTAKELRDRSGVSADLIHALADAGALGDPRVSTNTRRRFDSADERLLDVVRSLAELGLPDEILVSVVTSTLDHLDALGRHNQDLLFGSAGTWSAEERDRFRTQLPEHMDRLRDAVAWLVRLLQLRSAQRLLLSSGSTVGPNQRRSRGTRP